MQVTVRPSTTSVTTRAFAVAVVREKCRRRHRVEDCCHVVSVGLRFRSRPLQLGFGVLKVGDVQQSGDRSAHLAFCVEEGHGVTEEIQQLAIGEPYLDLLVAHLTPGGCGLLHEEFFRSQLAPVFKPGEAQLAPFRS